MLRHLLRYSWGYKKELGGSLLATMIGLWNAGAMPHSYVSGLVACGAFLVGLVCALNAARDLRHMNWWQRAVTAMLLCLLLYITPLTIWNTASLTNYADR